MRGRVWKYFLIDGAPLFGNGVIYAYLQGARAIFSLAELYARNA
jgi:hypothetical protein